MSHCSLESYNIIIFIFNSRTGDGNSDPSETGPEIIIIPIVVAVFLLGMIVLVLFLRKRKGKSQSTGKHVFI